MTAYTDPAAVLAAARDVDLLAGLLGPRDQPAVSGALLRATVAGTDRGAWTVDERAAADLALAALDGACQDAADRIEAALPADLPRPLDPVPRLVRQIGTGLALGRCLGDTPAGDDSAYAGLLRVAKDAAALLAQIQTGALRLSASAAASPAPGTAPGAGVALAGGSDSPGTAVFGPTAPGPWGDGYGRPAPRGRRGPCGGY